MTYKNHEGYTDNTAGKAIRNINRKKTQPKSLRLMYKIGDLQMFQDAIKVYNHDK